MADPFIVVAGSIATGKTGLVRRLAESLGAVALTEEVASNPYFERFYEDPSRWAFHSQVAFAADSLARHARAIGERAVVQDRTVYESVDVFGGLFHQLGHLNKQELELLAALRESAGAMPRQPTVLVYLHAPPSVLLERAANRGRPAERHLTEEYMQCLHEHYEEFILRWDRCTILSIDTVARDLRTESGLEILVDEMRAVQDN